MLVSLVISVHVKTVDGTSRLGFLMLTVLRKFFTLCFTFVGVVEDRPPSRRTFAISAEFVLSPEKSLAKPDISQLLTKN